MIFQKGESYFATPTIKGAAPEDRHSGGEERGARFFFSIGGIKPGARERVRRARDCATVYGRW